MRAKEIIIKKKRIEILRVKTTINKNQILKVNFLTLLLCFGTYQSKFLVFK